MVTGSEGNPVEQVGEGLRLTEHGQVSAGQVVDDDPWHPADHPVANRVGRRVVVEHP